MPYLDPITKRDVRSLGPGEAGELNFTLTEVLLKYIEFRGEKYQTYNDIVGALECAKLEMYRRMVAPYEDTKIAENGDVYPTPSPLPMVARVAKPAQGLVQCQRPFVDEEGLCTL